MKTLGRRLVAPFDLFWERFADSMPVSADHVERGSSLVFGDRSADAAAPDMPRWMSLPDDDLAYHAARELTLRLMESWGYPKPFAEPATRPIQRKRGSGRIWRRWS